MSRRMIAVLIAFTLVAAALASTAALGNSASQKAPQSQKKTYTFYLVAGIASDAFYLTMKKGAQAQAKKLGNVKVIFTGSPAAFSPNTQIPFLNGAIARKPDAILMDGPLVQCGPATRPAGARPLAGLSEPAWPRRS